MNKKGKLSVTFTNETDSSSSKQRQTNSIYKSSSAKHLISDSSIDYKNSNCNFLSRSPRAASTTEINIPSNTNINLINKNRCRTCSTKALNDNNKKTTNNLSSIKMNNSHQTANTNTVLNNNQSYNESHRDRSNTTESSNGGFTKCRHNQQSLLVPQAVATTSAEIGRNSSIGSVTFVEELQISRRPSVILQELLSARRPSAFMAALRPQNQRPRLMSMLHENPQNGSNKSLNMGRGSVHSSTGGPNCEMAIRSKRKNRRIGDDALSTALSALYCKLLVILGVAMPVTELISSKIPAQFYQGFYVYLYLGSITFVCIVYLAHMKSKALFSIIKSYHEKTSNIHIKRKVHRFGSFYLRVGAIAFGIGTMVYSGLEFGQYFELHGLPGCKNFFVALTPAARMVLVIVQMQFIFLNTTELDMARHKVIARFGLMHMVATNLCEWLYVLVEETKHEIYHIMHSKAHQLKNERIITEVDRVTEFLNDTTTLDFLQSNMTNFLDLSSSSEHVHSLTKRSTTTDSEHFTNCQRTNIMGSLVQDASPFLFPCTIEYSLICAVILYEMWKKVKSIPDITKTRNDLQKVNQRMAHHFSVDCSRAHRGMFTGIMIIVMTIICMIMYFVLYKEPGYELVAMQEVTICETVMYSLTSIAVIAAMIRMRDLKFLNKQNDKHCSSVSLDCTLLVLAQTGTYVYAMFSIIGSYFSIAENAFGSKEALIAEVIGLFQTSIQTLFILNASWRRCKGAQQQRIKPGRELVTFLLIANVCMWFIHTLIKGRAAFRSTHLEFFGIWAWTIITHVSMPLAIFYRFHSTICLFEIWKSTYKVKSDH